MGGTTALGIVFRMTTKPGLGGSLVALTLALLVGGTAGYLGRRTGEHSEATREPALSATVVGGSQPIGGGPSHALCGQASSVTVWPSSSQVVNSTT
jgi:hypothetical protein